MPAVILTPEDIVIPILVAVSVVPATSVIRTTSKLVGTLPVVNAASPETVPRCLAVSGPTAKVVAISVDVAISVAIAVASPVVASRPRRLPVVVPRVALLDVSATLRFRRHDFAVVAFVRRLLARRLAGVAFAGTAVAGDAALSAERRLGFIELSEIAGKILNIQIRVVAKLISMRRIYIT